MDEIITVEELMVPVDEYATVNEDATLFEAVMALEEAQEKIDREKCKYLHRGLLVYDAEHKVVGKIGQLDVLRALEPRYKDFGDTRALSLAGLNQNILKSLLENMVFCDSSLLDMCAKAIRVRVKDFMHTPRDGEFVKVDASLCEAIHSFIIGHHQSLLVVNDGKIKGILRLADAFMKVFEMMKQCER